MMTEDALLQGVHCFDENALTEVYDRYSPGVYRYAWRLLGDEDLAEECVAETFSRLLNALARGKGPRQHLQAYLYRVAHNWITDHYRYSAANQTPPDAETPADGDDDTGEAVAKRLEQQMLRAALRRLTPEQRQVVVLRYLEDWQPAEVALAMQKPVGAVKALQHRALRALRRVLAEEEEGLT